MTGIVYAREQDLSVDDYIRVVGGSRLGRSRPIGDRDRVARMLAGSSIIVTARLDGECIGIARGTHDGAWVCYLADLAVLDTHQGRGIGRQLLATTKHLLGPELGLTLLSIPEAVGFYDGAGSALGMKHYPHAYWWDRERGAE
jgi:GNAT superfamily N-acetyltransferase